MVDWACCWGGRSSVFRLRTVWVLVGFMVSGRFRVGVFGIFFSIVFILVREDGEEGLGV